MNNKKTPKKQAGSAPTPALPELRAEPREPESARESWLFRHAKAARAVMEIVGLVGLGIAVGAFLQGRNLLPSALSPQNPLTAQKDERIKELEDDLATVRAEVHAQREERQAYMQAYTQTAQRISHLESRSDRERDARSRAESSAAAAAVALADKSRSAPELERLGLWSNGQPSAAARAEARAYLFSSDDDGGLRSALLNALAGGDTSLEIQKELVVLVHNAGSTWKVCLESTAKRESAGRALLDLEIPSPRSGQSDAEYEKSVQAYDEKRIALQAKEDDLVDEERRCAESHADVASALVDALRMLAGGKGGEKAMTAGK